MPTPVFHHRALGVHLGAFVQPTAPSTADVQDGVLWLDTSAGPPYVLKRWDQDASAWHPVQMDSTGYPLPRAHRVEVQAHSGGLSGGNSASDFVVFGPAAREVVIPGFAMALPGAVGGVSIFFTVALLAQCASDDPGNVRVRLRRDDVDGALLWSADATLTSGPSPFTALGEGASFYASASIDDTDASSNLYVLTAQSTVFPGAELGVEDREWTLNADADAADFIRVVHAALGAQIVWPFPTLQTQPHSILARDDATGLPAWTTAPAIRDVPAVPPLETDVVTCNQTRCGAAAALRDKIIGDYDFWRQIINTAIKTVAGGLIGAVLEEILALLLAVEAASWIISVFRRIKPWIKATSPILLPSLIPEVTGTQADTLLQICYCSLSCEGLEVIVQQTNMRGITDGILANPSAWASDLMRELLAEVAYYYPLSGWQAAITNAAPSSLCDGISCG